MRLKFSLSRGDDVVDLVAVVDTTVTVGELADRIAAGDPRRKRTSGTAYALVEPGSRGGVLSADATLATAGVRSGATYALSTRGGSAAAAPAPSAAHLVVVAGPDAGLEVPLRLGANTVGRDPACEVRLKDPLVSRMHAKITVGDVVEVVDLGSANGISTGGVPTTRAVIRTDDVVEIGETSISVRLLRGASAGDSGEVHFNRSPRIAPIYEGPTLRPPETPGSPRHRRLPVIPLVAPILLGALLYLITHSPTSLVFVAVSPLMLIGNALEGRLGDRRSYREEVEAFHASLAEIERVATEAVDAERSARLAESPSTSDLVEAVQRQTPLLWTRRPEHGTFLEVRLGIGRQRSRTTIDADPNRRGNAAFVAEIDALTARFRDIDGVPVVERLSEVGAIGVAGIRRSTLDVARALVAQMVTLHSPAELVLTAFASASTADDWDWLKWLPHTSAPQSPVGDVHLASAAGDANHLAERLEEVVDQRLSLGEARAGTPIVVVLVDDPPSDRAQLVQLAERGGEVGVHFIWIGGSTELLPAVCRTFVDVTADADRISAGFVRTGQAIRPIEPERLSAADAVDLARRMSPLLDAGATVDDDSDLPTSVPLVELLGREIADSPAVVIDRWLQTNSLLHGVHADALQKRPGSLRAVLGQTASEPLTLDLRTNGPHALVGGTTGSGKSELLQSWILSLAASYSPDRLTFLLVDYKGGSAFSECRNLPHTVGMVTDLTPHLVQRTITSLNAELRYREHVLAGKGAKDLIELEKGGDRDAPPNLIIVVDEFAALVQEVPEFVDGMVNVGQRGRSLGLHLILATQRPAGVIKDNLRANTNLRLALRVADETDSSNVLDSPVAASFDPSTPGRAAAKVGPGRLVAFQSAYVGGHTSDQKQRREIALSELRFGRGGEWQGAADSEDEEAARSTQAALPSDIARLTATIRAASTTAEVPTPRRPWLDVLASTYDLARLPVRHSDDRLYFGVADDPDNQQQLPVSFNPDIDGNLAVYGTGGSGKSLLLRTLAIFAGYTDRHGGPCHVYALDFGARGLQMLEQLPHVGAVIPGDDRERTTRLLSMLRAMIDERAGRYSAVDAGSLPEYRKLAGAPGEARIILLLDGFWAFRQDYEVSDRSRYWDMLIAIAAGGRQVGIHVVLTADRVSAIPSALASALPRRVVLRLAEENEYSLMGVPKEVLAVGSPPGRAVVDELETQVAVFGGSPNVREQATALSELAVALEGRATRPAPPTPIRRLPELVLQQELPDSVGDLPVLGIEFESLAAIGFQATGTFVVAGPRASGRTTALFGLHRALGRWRPDTRFFYCGNARSEIARTLDWGATAMTADEVPALAEQIEAALTSRREGSQVAVFVEGIGDFVNGPADIRLQEVVRRIIELEGLLIAEGETSSLMPSFQLLQMARTHRAGIVLQPDQTDGLNLFKTPFPKSNRGDYPAGRGLHVRAGRTQVVQLPLAP